MISLILIFIASIASAIMDGLNFGRFNGTIFSDPSKFNQQFWNFNISSVNKWKNGIEADGEAFFLSSTLFVAFTDAWHLFKTIMLTCLYLPIPLFLITPITNSFLLNPFILLNLNWSINYIIFYITIGLVWFFGFQVTEKLITKKTLT